MRYSIAYYNCFTGSCRLILAFYCPISFVRICRLIASKLEALGIADLFDFKASAEDYGALKPSCRPFEEMLSALGVKAEEALYTVDSRSKDIDGAKNAGMHTALISRSVKVYNNADIIFSSWEEFRKMVL